MAGILEPPPAASPPRGRRRAASRHRRVRHLPPPRAALRSALTLAVLLLIGVLVALAWSTDPEHEGPLPPGLTLAAVLLSVALVFAVAIRAGLGAPAALLAAALTGAYPEIVLPAGVGVTEHLAVVALLTAVLLLLGRTRRRILVPAAGLLAGVAASVAPLAVAAAPFLAAQAARTLHRRTRVPTLASAGAVYFATVAVGWLVVGVDPGAAPVWGTALLDTWVQAAPIALAVSAAALLLGAASAQLRPLAGYALTLITLSVWPDGDEVVRYTVLLAPALALLTAAAADRALRPLSRFRSPAPAR